MDYRKLGHGPTGLLLLVAAVGILYVVTSRDVQRRSINAYCDQADKALQANDPELAILLLRDAIAIDPCAAEPRAKLAMVYVTCRHLAGASLGMELPSLHTEIDQLVSSACKLRPDDVGYARDYALWTLDAKSYGKKVDWEASLEAWRNYLSVHLRDSRTSRAHPDTYMVTLYQILLRLSKIEAERGNAREAEAYMGDALALGLDTPVSNRSAFLESYLKERVVTATSRLLSAEKCEPYP